MMKADPPKYDIISPGNDAQQIQIHRFKMPEFSRQKIRNTNQGLNPADPIFFSDNTDHSRFEINKVTSDKAI